MSVLRHYQVEIVDQARELMRQGKKSLLIQAPTGAGKTLLTAHMVGAAASRGKRTWFICHRRELVKQAAHTFEFEGLPHGFIAAEFDENRTALIQICSLQTLARRHMNHPSPDFIVWDECHHIAADSWKAIFKAYPKAYHVGLTATPKRRDGKGLAEFFEAMVLGPQVATLIEQGYLVPFRVFAPPGIDTTGIRTSMGDFAIDELEAASDRPAITGSAIAEYKEHAPGSRAIVFCVSVKHSRHVCEAFLSEGVAAEHVDGETSAAERDAAIERFRRGSTKVLCNVDLFGEGFDLPAAEVLVCLRPTRSESLWLQMCGRVLRTAPYKQGAIILDHAGNSDRHGFADDPRAWALEYTKVRSKKKPTVSIRTCPVCYAAQRPTARQCFHCGHVFVIEYREVQEVDGHLEEIDRLAAQKARAKERGRAHDYASLVELGRKRGYKNPTGWAYMVMKARGMRKK